MRHFAKRYPFRSSNIIPSILAPAGKLAGSVKPGSVTQTTMKATANGTTPQGAPKSKSPQFLQKLSAINARAGENVKFVAEIDGDPQPTVSWQFNGRQLYGGRDQKVCGHYMLKKI